eukprot:g1325.t1
MPSSEMATLLEEVGGPSFVENLERRLNDQVTQNTYCLDDNLALVKSYRMFPHLLNVENIALVLLKAVMQMPSTDFLQLSYLIAEEIREKNAIVQFAYDLNAHLEAAEFSQFWRRLKDLPRISLPSITGFEDAARTFIMNVLQCAYSRVPLSVLSNSLGYEGNVTEVEGLVQKMGWTLENGDFVAFPLNVHNQPRGEQFQEAIQFDKLTDIISKLTSVS